MSAEKVPALLETKHIMAVLGWPRWRVIHWLKTTKAGEKHGRRWFTTPEILAARFPQAGQAVKFACDESDRRTRVAEGKTLESRVKLLAAKLESTTQRVRALERECRRNRSEIRKMRRRLRNAANADAQRETPSETE